MRIKFLSLALAVAAFAASTAQAYHAPGEPKTASPQSASTWTASSRQIDQLGPKHVALQHAIARAPATVAKVVKPAGFSWGDAALGAGIAGVAVALVAVLTVLLERRGRRGALPDRSEPAGA